jgi:hypothetical protein
MAVGITPIYTRIIQSGEAVNSISFNAIPQIYNDLLVVFTAKTTPTAYNEDGVNFQFNNSSVAEYSCTFLQWDGGSTFSTRTSNGGSFALGLSNTSSTNLPANAFGSNRVYIPNYRSSLFKTAIAETHNTTTTSFILNRTADGTWRNTAAILSIGISSAQFVAGSTFSLYGIRG